MTLRRLNKYLSVKKNTSAHMTEQAGVVTIVLQVHLNILNYFLLDFSLTFF